ncbi:MAG: hypothetical protein ABS81_13405 [Pseudonocardia sp. SCN 72-86]|nr:MAG: hypothetical protein ABS81_13405 [Pseudonocardia sp. SCN 72-86]
MIETSSGTHSPASAAASSAPIATSARLRGRPSGPWVGPVRHTCPTGTPSTVAVHAARASSACRNCSTGIGSGCRNG